MSNLIPTPRTDKNGVTRIRHMKPDAAVSAPRKPIPRVPKVPSQEHLQLDKALRGAISSNGYGFKEKLARFMDAEAAAELTEFVTRQHGNMRPFTVSQQIITAIENPTHGKPLLKRIVTHLDDLLRISTDENPFSLMTGLGDYKGKRYKREQEFALLRVADAVSHLPPALVLSDVPYPLEGYSLADQKLRDLATSRLDRTDDIIEIIKKHDIFDGERIAVMLDSGVHSHLQEGAL